MSVRFATTIRIRLKSSKNRREKKGKTKEKIYMIFLKAINSNSLSSVIWARLTLENKESK